MVADAGVVGGWLPDWVSLGVLAGSVPRDDDYEEVAVRLTETLEGWGCWDREWTTPTSGGITSARKRLGPEPVVEVFDRVAVPVAEELTRGRFSGRGG